MNRKLTASLLLITFMFTCRAQIPAGYYDSAAGLSGTTLKTALYNIIKDHTVISYTDLWTAYYTTDDKPGNIVWDMYSDNPSGTTAYTFTLGSDQCGSYGGEGDCYNREHSFPASWFNDASPMYSDLFLVYPTDGYVNNKRSNYPFGEVNSPSWTSTNGSRLGTCSYPGYTSTVFEPIDEYKGDFARSYFYIATRYQNLIAGWISNTGASAVLAGNNTVCFTTWQLNMLYAWHQSDPVSTKETDRNNAVYTIQENRNPYIDHPEWVASVWNFPTALEEVSASSQPRIFPVPATSQLQIELPEIPRRTELQITDLSGRILLSDKMDGASCTLDIRHLAPGMYLLRLSHSEGTSVSHFIKE